MAEPIEMPFGFRTPLATGNHACITWGSRYPIGRGNFGEKKNPFHYREFLP